MSSTNEKKRKRQQSKSPQQDENSQTRSTPPGLGAKDMSKQARGGDGDSRGGGVPLEPPVRRTANTRRTNVFGNAHTTKMAPPVRKSPKANCDTQARAPHTKLTKTSPNQSPQAGGSNFEKVRKVALLSSTAPFVKSASAS
eukprot:gene6927-2638_t